MKKPILTREHTSKKQVYLNKVEENMIIERVDNYKSVTNLHKFASVMSSAFWNISSLESRVIKNSQLRHALMNKNVINAENIFIRGLIVVWI